MGLKPVEIKPVVIKPVVIKPSKPATPTVTPPSSPQAEKKVEKKSVRFHGAVKVALFERASSTEAEQGWYSSSQLEAMKDEGSELAAAYRKFCANGGDNDDRMKKSDYRGVEHQTIIRQKQMILANQSALYAQELGCPQTKSPLCTERALHGRRPKLPSSRPFTITWTHP